MPAALLWTIARERSVIAALKEKKYNPRVRRLTLTFHAGVPVTDYKE
jgi:hypothetical protein